MCACPCSLCFIIFTVLILWSCHFWTLSTSFKAYQEYTLICNPYFLQFGSGFNNFSQTYPVTIYLFLRAVLQFFSKPGKVQRTRAVSWIKRHRYWYRAYCNTVCAHACMYITVYTDLKKKKKILFVFWQEGRVCVWQTIFNVKIWKFACGGHFSNWPWSTRGAVLPLIGYPRMQPAWMMLREAL